MPPVIQPGEPVGDGEALQLALALALPHAGHQVLEHLRQLAHLAPTARRELDRVVPRGHLGRHAGETSERAYEKQAHVAGQPCHHKEHDQREARAASPAGLTERLRPWHVPTAAQRSAGTRRRVPMTFLPSAPLYSTVLPSPSSSSCAIGSLVRIRSAELTRDFRISLP